MRLEGRALHVYGAEAVPALWARRMAYWSIWEAAVSELARCAREQAE